MKKALCFSLFCFFLFSCGEEKVENDWQLVKGNFISFPVNDMASPNASTAVLYDSDSGEHLFLYNHIIKQLQISEFPSNTLKLNIPLNFDQAQRVKSFSGGTMKAKDSVFVTFYPPDLNFPFF